MRLVVGQRTGVPRGKKGLGGDPGARLWIEGRQAALELGDRRRQWHGGRRLGRGVCRRSSGRGLCRGGLSRRRRGRRRGGSGLRHHLGWTQGGLQAVAQEQPGRIVDIGVVADGGVSSF